MNQNPYASPSAHVSDEVGTASAMREPSRRGWALTVFLVLGSLGSLFSIAYYAGLIGTAYKTPFPAWIMRTFLFASVLRLASIMAIWCWLRFGVVLYVLLTLVVVPVFLIHGYYSAAWSSAGIVLLVYLVRHKWQQMRWGVLPPNFRSSGP